MRSLLLAVALGAGTVASPAAATVAFNATDVIRVVGSDPIPLTAVNGTFSYDYSGGDALTLTAFSLDLGSTHFGLADVGSTFDSTNDALQIGGLVNGINMLVGYTDDFVLSLTFDPLTSTGGNGVVQFMTANSNSFYMATTASAGPVPEPATWAMMLVGFGAIGFAMRRSRKQSGTVLQAA